jgi:hypothetical protein
MTRVCTCASQREASFVLPPKLIFGTMVAAGQSSPLVAQVSMRMPTLKAPILRDQTPKVLVYDENDVDLSQVML